MLTRYEKRKEILVDKIWIGKWKNLKNYSHWHDEVELIYCVHGIICITIQDNNIVLTENECVFIPSTQIHKINSENDAIAITILIDNNLISSFTNLYKLCHYKLSQKYNIIEFYNIISNELKEKQKFYSLIIESQINILMTNIFRQEPIATNIQDDTINHNNFKYEFLKSITKEIELNYKYVDFNTLCNKFSYTPSYFSKLFKSITGLTLSKYISIIKIEHAIIELQSKNHNSITNIASECGFSSIRSFNRTFKEITGYCPTELPFNYSLPNSNIRIYERIQFNPTQTDSIRLD